MMYLFCLFFACKEEKKEILGSTSIEQEPPSNQIFGNQWVADSLQEEFGFEILEWKDNIYISNPQGTQGTIYRITEAGREEVFSGLGRLGHQIFVWDDTLYAHAPLFEKIQDQAGNILAEGSFGKIAVSQVFWYAISGNSVLRNGEIWQEFEHKPYDIAVCNGSVGISFPFGAHKLWVDGEWQIQADDKLDRYLHCFEYEGKIQWLLGGADRLLILDGDSLLELPSERRTFGQEIAARENGSEVEVFISAPDSGVSLTGWVGRYQWSDKSLLEVWNGETANQRFGYSLLVQEDGILISAPNPTEKNSNKSYVKKIEFEAAE